MDACEKTLSSPKKQENISEAIGDGKHVLLSIESERLHLEPEHGGTVSS